MLDCMKTYPKQYGVRRPAKRMTGTNHSSETFSPHPVIPTGSPKPHEEQVLLCSFSGAPDVFDLIVFDVRLRTNQ